jgi:hypothetical protein
VLSRDANAYLIENFISKYLFLGNDFAMSMVNNDFIFHKLVEFNLYAKYISSLSSYHLLTNYRNSGFVKKIISQNLMSQIVFSEFPGTVVDAYSEGLISKLDALKCKNLLPIHRYAIDQRKPLKKFIIFTPRQMIYPTRLTSDAIDSARNSIVGVPVFLAFPYTLTVDVFTMIAQPVVISLEYFERGANELFQKDQFIYQNEFEKIYYYQMESLGS